MKIKNKTFSLKNEILAFKKILDEVDAISRFKDNRVRSVGLISRTEQNLYFWVEYLWIYRFKDKPYS